MRLSDRARSFHAPVGEAASCSRSSRSDDDDGSERLEAASPAIPVTRVGRTLRRYRLDELPQLVNVRGDVSGRSPEDTYVDLTDPLHQRVFSAKPGITGLAQLAYRDEATLLAGVDAEQRYRDEILPAKLRLDAEYLDRRSTLLDVQILARTVAAVLR